MCNSKKVDNDIIIVYNVKCKGKETDMISEREIEQRLLEFDPLIMHNAKKFSIRGYQVDDLAQEFRMATVRALKNFDESKGTSLKTFVIKYINNSISALIITQNRFKRGEAEFLLDAYGEQSKNNWLRSFDKSPEDIDRDLRNEEMMREFLLTKTCGDWSIEILFEGITVREIAQREGVTHQYIYAIHNKNLKDLKIKIREWFE